MTRFVKAFSAGLIVVVFAFTLSGCDSSSSSPASKTGAK